MSVMARRTYVAKSRAPTARSRAESDCRCHGGNCFRPCSIQNLYVVPCIPIVPNQEARRVTSSLVLRSGAVCSNRGRQCPGVRHAQSLAPQPNNADGPLCENEL